MDYVAKELNRAVGTVVDYAVDAIERAVAEVAESEARRSKAKETSVKTSLPAEKESASPSSPQKSRSKTPPPPQIVDDILAAGTTVKRRHTVDMVNQQEAATIITTKQSIESRKKAPPPMATLLEVEKEEDTSGDDVPAPPTVQLKRKRGRPPHHSSTAQGRKSNKGDTQPSTDRLSPIIVECDALSTPPDEPASKVAKTNHQSCNPPICHCCSEGAKVVVCNCCHQSPTIVML